MLWKFLTCSPILHTMSFLMFWVFMSCLGGMFVTLGVFPFFRGGGHQTFIFEERDCLHMRDRQRSSIIMVYYIYNTQADFMPVVVVNLHATIKYKKH